jgi:hypothetical protein
MKKNYRKKYLKKQEKKNFGVLQKQIKKNASSIPPDLHVEVSLYPDLTEIKIIPDSTTDASPKLKNIKKRGVVTGYSNGSRNRHMKHLARLEDYPEYFITLTYPADYPEDKEIIKKHLKNIKKRLQIKFPGSSGTWKLEAQKRGAPHYHFLYDIPDDRPESFDIKQAQKWLARAWYDIVGSQDDKHLVAGTQFVKLNGKKQIKYYVSKYCAKEQYDTHEWGNRWGRIGKQKLSKPVVYRMDGSDLVQLRRLFKRWMKKLSPRYAKRLSWLKSFYVFASKKFTEQILDFINNTSSTAFITPKLE